MPLKIGKSRRTLLENFKTEKAHGKDEDQAWAIAYDVARRSGGNYPRKRKRKKKGSSCA